MIAQSGGKFVSILPRGRKEETAFRHYLTSGETPPMWHLLMKIDPVRGASGPGDILCTGDTPFEKTAEGYRII